MTLITTQSREDVAMDELSEKTKHETRFKREIKSLLTDISKDFRTNFKVTGRLLDVNPYKTDIVAVLRRNYRKIANSFKNNIRKDLPAQKQLDADIDQAIAEYTINHSEEQADLIIETTEKEQRKVVNSVIGGAIADELIFTNEEIANLAYRELIDLNESRSETIAVTETQNISETTKQIEAGNLMTTSAGIALLGDRLLVKQWNSILDGKTRIAHAMADGQTVDINQAFTVDGQRLRYPGDTGLGATAGNVINCRCAVNYRLRG